MPTVTRANARAAIQSTFGRDPDGNPLAGDALLALVRELSGDTVLLSFSRGKDALAAWLYLRPHFKIIPYHLDWIPGLSFVDDSIKYYEDFFGTHIYRLPHPMFSNYLIDYAWQTPEQGVAVKRLDLVECDLADMDNLLCDAYATPETYTAVGMRAKDNLERRRLVWQQGSVGPPDKRRRFFYPVWDWNVEQVGAIIKQHGCKLPLDYKYWGRTIGAYDYQFLKPLSVHFPADYERVRQWFPLIDLELFRYEQVGRHDNA
jgi:hypothetical protein